MVSNQKALRAFYSPSPCDVSSGGKQPTTASWDKTCGRFTPRFFQVVTCPKLAIIVVLNTLNQYREVTWKSWYALLSTELEWIGQCARYNPGICWECLDRGVRRPWAYTPPVMSWLTADCSIHFNSPPPPPRGGRVALWGGFLPTCGARRPFFGKDDNEMIMSFYFKDTMQFIKEIFAYQEFDELLVIDQFQIISSMVIETWASIRRVGLLSYVTLST